MRQASVVALIGLFVSSLVIGCADVDDPAGEEGVSEDDVISARDVVFSPQPAASSHNVRVAQEADRATKSIDVAIYSYSDVGIRDALGRAVARGVKVRLIFEDGGEQERMEPAAKAASMSGKLEGLGIDVRYVNKIMHHKFMIVDGPRDEIAKAKTATLVTGSANWSNSAATTFDENTLIIKKNAELNMRFQREFDLMWTHTRDFSSRSPAIAQDLSTLQITDENTPSTTGSDVFFTSSNFTVRDTTFSSTSANTVADAMIAGINSATRSIHVASGHFRSRPIAEALIAKKQASPNLDIKVYLDAQEYISKSGDDAQKRDLATCLETATTDAKKRSCLDKGFLFGYDLGKAGIDVRYKYYAYRWDHSYAPQMHNKYMIIDEETLFNGSYNLSDNAEHNTFENMLKLSGRSNATVVKTFERQFQVIWETARAENKLATLTTKIEAPTGDIPIVFDSMALTWDEVTTLKGKIRTACPAVDSTVYRRDAARRRFCER